MLEVLPPSLGAMFDLTFTPEDKEWLSHEHPSLKISDVSGVTVLSGKLKFDMVYEDKGNSFIVFPKKYEGDGIHIKDEYEIKVLFQKGGVSELPQVFETGSRIKNLAENKKLPLSDFHVNNDESVCLYVAGKEIKYFPTGFRTQIFFNQLVIPFFYAQTYFHQYNRWPWGEYGHGILGIFEWYNENKNVDTADVEKMLTILSQASDWQLIKSKFKGKDWVKGHTICFCGKNTKIRNCHPQALAGMWRFKNDLEKFQIKMTITDSKEKQIQR